MIPILYGNAEREFTSNGIGRLVDAVSCTVTEERNGIYECELRYPITGQHYSEIQMGRIIYATHDHTKTPQPFEIYLISRPIDGVVTINARHISYRLINTIVKPYSATTITAALAGFRSNLMTENEFTFWTDKSSRGTFNVPAPSSIRSLLGGTEGSLLDVFGGGEYEFDKFTVRLYQHRGIDSGVTIRYGKNLADLTQEVSAENVMTGIVPVFNDGETVVYGRVVYGDAPAVFEEPIITDELKNIVTDEGEPIIATYTPNMIAVMDFTSDYETPPTSAQLEERAAAYLESVTPWIPRENLQVDIVSLEQTDEYMDYAELQEVNLCDKISVYYPALGVTAENMEIIRTVYDVLLDKYSEIEIGDSVKTFAEVVRGSVVDQLEKKTTETLAAVTHATELITGGLGGHLVYMFDDEGKPTELLVMDTEDVATAVHVLRINVNGIGFSSNGVDGPFETAWTLDGSFLANFITAGVLSDASGRNTWDLEEGSLSFYSDEETDGVPDYGIQIVDGSVRIIRSGVYVGRLRSGHNGSGGNRGVWLEAGTDATYVGLSYEDPDTEGAAKPALAVNVTEKAVMLGSGVDFFTFQNKRAMNLNADSRVYQRGYLVYGINNNYHFQMGWASPSLWFYVDESAQYYLSQSSSDRRLKYEIENIKEETLDAVESIDLKQFRMKKGSGKLRYGVIAQDLLEALNSEDVDMLLQSPSEDDDYWYVDYEQFLVTRLAADERKIKNLEATIDDLEKRLSALEKK